MKGRVVEFVKYQSKHAPIVWKLLGKTLIVDVDSVLQKGRQTTTTSIDAAVELAERLGGEYKFVTLKGEFCSADGAMKLGPLGKTTGLISRKSRLRQLQETIANITAEIAGVECQIEKNNQANAHLAKLRKDLRTAIYEASTEEMQVNSKLNVIEQNIKRLRQEQPLIAGEIGLLEEQITQSVQKEYDSKQKLQELEAVNSQRTAHIKELEVKYAEQRTQQQSQISRLTDLKVALGQIAEQSKAVKQTITSLQNQVQENRTAAEAAQAEIQSCSEQLAEAQRDILNCEATVSELFVEKERNQQGSRMLHSEVEKLLEEQKQTEQLIRQKQTQENEIEQSINQLKIELGQ